MRTLRRAVSPLFLLASALALAGCPSPFCEAQESDVPYGADAVSTRPDGSPMTLSPDTTCEEVCTNILARGGGDFSACAITARDAEGVPLQVTCRELLNCL